MNVDLWFDPVCPYTWNTARWAIDAAAANGDTLTWRPFPLALKNGDTAGRSHRASLRALRTVAHLDSEALGAWYAVIGAAIHWDNRPWGDDVIEYAARESGVDARLASADDPHCDEVLLASMKDALALVGDDVGVPILAIAAGQQQGGQEQRGAFGPVWSPPPTGQAALDTWRATLALIGTPGFSELKRSRSDTIELVADDHKPGPLSDT